MLNSLTFIPKINITSTVDQILWCYDVNIQMKTL